MASRAVAACRVCDGAVLREGPRGFRSGAFTGKATGAIQPRQLPGAPPVAEQSRVAALRRGGSGRLLGGLLRRLGGRLRRLAGLREALVSLLHLEVEAVAPDLAGLAVRQS